MRSITHQELKQLQGINIIDIRDRFSYQKGNIPTSKNIPYILLLANPNAYLDFNQIYYIYCEQGITSERVCMMLEEKGYKVVNIIGGYQQYKRG